MENSLITQTIEGKSSASFCEKICRIIICTVTFLISGSSLAQVYINEIMVNPSGSNDGSNMPNTAEWIEFYNSNSTAVNIGCWFFTDGDFSVTFPSGASIPAKGYYTVASASGSGLAPNLNWATCGCTTNNPGSNSSLSGNQVGIFTNSSEQVLLYNSSGVLQDAIIWGGGQLSSALTLTIGSVGSCASQVVTIPGNTASYESIGTSSDGVAKEREYDGSPTWQNAGSGSFGATNAVILPIELIDFGASLQNGQVILTWQTATEINNNYFVLEKSKNGVEFEILNTIKGAGNNNSYRSYSDIDLHPFAGMTYYRLKQVDFDESFSYSQIVAIESGKAIDFCLYPNPTNSGLIKVSSLDTKNATIEIVDGLGRVVLNEVTNGNVAEFDLSKFGKGIYLVVITSREKSVSGKVIYN